MKTRQSWVASASMLETPAAVRPFVVVNPLARRASSAVAEVVGQCYRMGIDAPRSLATTREETGSQQARQAVEAGADVVLVIGGDGTVRQVARELAGTGIRLGIVALGSGNVLAYNLGLTSLDLRTKVAIALSGPSTELDLGWARLQTVDGRQLDEPFLTMAGIGRDAKSIATIVDTDREDTETALLILNGGITVASDGIDPDTAALIRSKAAGDVRRKVGLAATFDAGGNLSQRFRRRPLGQRVDRAADTEARGSPDAAGQKTVGAAKYLDAFE